MALSLILSVALALTTTSAFAQQAAETSSQPQTQSAIDPTKASTEGASGSLSDAPAAPPQTTPAQQTPAQPGPPQQPQEQPKEVPGQPVGTAVAPYEKGIGVAASRPAGAVIAPAKQRRTRSFLIKGGLVLGAAIAVGTVVGLSSSSPSRPH